MHLADDCIQSDSLYKHKSYTSDQYVFSLRINPSAFLSAELQKTLNGHYIRSQYIVYFHITENKSFPCGPFNKNMPAVLQA